MQDVVIFLTDGAANQSPVYTSTNPAQIYKDRPCYTGVTSAQAMHSTTWVYSIGYAIGTRQACQKHPQKRRRVARDHAGAGPDRRSPRTPATTSTAPTPGS